MSLNVESSAKLLRPPRETFPCPYCDASINAHAISCRACGRDLTAVLPLLRRLDEVEGRLAALEARQEAQESERVLALPAPAETPSDLPAESTPPIEPVPAPAGGRRNLLALLIGYGAVMLAYCMVVLWLDLPLAVLRLSSIAIPFGVGLLYLGSRPRLTWLDSCVAVLFAFICVGSMNALLGWIDSMPMLPQGTAAWRETLYYALSIGASLFCGMLLRLLLVSLSARGLTSLPRLRQSVLAANGKVPMDALKAIELSILLVGTILSAITGLFAGLLGVLR